MDVQLITQQTLEDADIDLTGEDIHALLAYLNELAEERISTAITDTLSAEQCEEMVKLQDAASEKELSAWLHKHVPALDELIEAEIATIIEEIVEPDDEA